MSRHKGDIAESRAVDFLKSNGFKIVEQNFYAKKMGEIDIIACKDDIYHFVEVKSGSGFEPVYNVTTSKINKLLKSVQYYLKLKNINSAYSIDVITLQDDELDYIENITL